MNHMLYALREYGTKEIVGDNHNPRIVQYSTDIGNTWVKDDEVAWCSEFVNWCLLQAGIQGTRSAVARSFLNWGEELQTPEFGCLVLFTRAEADQATGHIAFFVADAGDRIYCLGGNQSNEVNISKFPKSRVVTYRKVPGEPIKTVETLPLPPTGASVLRFGSKGENVRLLQKLLNKSLTGDLVEDGIFGNKTLRAVKVFQAKADLSPDGIVGKETFAKLIESL